MNVFASNVSSTPTGRGRRTGRTALAVAVAGAAVGAFTAQPLITASAAKDGYSETALVSDIAGRAAQTDVDLKNPWGIVAGPATPFWVSDNNAGVTTLYLGTGNKVFLNNGKALIPHVIIPGIGGNPGAPTGVVFARGAGFTLSANGRSADSFFIFATEDGTIAAWSPTVDLASAITTVDHSTVPSAQNGAVYKGLALAAAGGANQLYATNFRAGTVDVFDTSFNQVTPGGGAFADAMIPAGYAPFGITAVPQGLLVSYALQNAAKHDDVAGQGHGFVDLYSTSGVLLDRLVRHGLLNSPWGMAMAPASGFGRFSGDLLVGNFGDGTIHAYSTGGQFAGALRGADGRPLVNEGLWGLRFGNGSAAGPTTTLFFTAGLNGETDGLFGAITAAGG
ncbi:MAG TPA: TIGR03118 family protein [Candidatus Angelobacter sp.]|jgi:uncharacterized protein (TIGR03118 family)|nr:TIGR03118 family protein [Candidatus Angelobacter sp.]